MPLTRACARSSRVKDSEGKAMNGMTDNGAVLRQRLRIVGWTGAAVLLALPFVAMQFTREVQWTASDFAIFGAMLAAAGLGWEFVARKVDTAAYQLAAAIAVVTAFLLVWANLAVGLVGDGSNPVNLAYFGVLVLGIAGGFVARFKAAGMARTLFAMAAVHVALGAFALLTRAGAGDPGWPRDVIGVTIVFGGLWIGSGLLFRSAARAA